MLFKLTYVCALASAHTWNLFVYIHYNIYSQVYMFHFTDTSVYDSVLCELTYVCALASAQT